jgi:alanine racemase
MAEVELNSWCEVSASALRDNIRTLRASMATGTLLGIVVKSDAYGHGLALSAREFLQAGADWLIVNSIAEAECLRWAEREAPIYICAQVAPFEAERVVKVGARVALCDAATARAVGLAARAAGCTVSCHIKVETGTYRQGVALSDVLEFARLVTGLEGLALEGLTTHFADIEDTTDHAFAQGQLSLLQEVGREVCAAGINVPMVHAANSAAALLWPETHGALVRAGIAAYGLWPSSETYATALERRAAGDAMPSLYPALSWKARITQVKQVPAGAYIGYGRTFRATHPMCIGIVPVGYFEGYDRRLSNVGHVLVNGVRAPVRGRVCMNMFMVDLTHMPTVVPGQVVTLLGTEGDEGVGADQWAAWMGSIHYEVISRIHPQQPRLLRMANGQLQWPETGVLYE